MEFFKSMGQKFQSSNYDVLIRVLTNKFRLGFMIEDIKY